MRLFARSIMILPFFLMTTSVAHAFTSAHLSSQRYGGASDDNGLVVTVDAAGNVYMTGTFQGTVDFGGGGLVSAGLTDLFIAKYNAIGVHQWSVRAGGTSNETPFGIAVDGSGVYLTGSFSGTADFGGGNLVSAGSNDLFLIKYHPQGFHLWSQRFGGTGGDEGRGIGLDLAGNIYLAGDFGGTADFGGGNLVSAGLNDMLLAKYNSSGTHIWSKRIGGTHFEVGYGIAVDGMGNFAVSGSFGNTVDFGGGNLVSAGGVDVFLARYNSLGNHIWSQRFGGAGIDEGASVAMDFAGNVIATGYFQDTVNFGGSNLVSAGGYDIFFAKYNVMGAHQWSYGVGGTGTDLGRGIAVDGSGNVFTTGSFQNTANFGGGNLVSAGGFDAYLVKYNASGVYQWGRRMGSTANDAGFSLAAEASGNIVTSGAFSGTVSLGGNPLVSAGVADIYLARYAGGNAEPAITSIADIGNDQGRKVKISFQRSGHDQINAASPIVHYEAYRRSDAAPALSSGLEARDAAMIPGWTPAGMVYAHGETEYSIDVPTIGDSTITLGQYRSTFFIRAATAVPTTFNDSPPDSGYSLDNLAPGAPQNLVFDTGDLSWDESAAADFDFFTVYGSNTDTFGTSVVVDYGVAPSMDVSGSPYIYYFVTATDFSGNEGKPAEVNTLSGVGGTPKSYVLSVANYPNPFNPRTTVKYTAPSPGEVKVQIYDARGALVKTLFDGYRAEGAYTVTWDGRTDDAAVAASGVYFVRIEHHGATRSKKMVLLK